MIRTAASALAALALTLPLAAQEAPVALAPGEIVAAAGPQDWIRIAPEDLLVMALAPAADGTERKVVIQLMPPPFSQGWVANIRTLARAGWYDGISINRVQDNYVVQWGDPNYDNPEATGQAKPLPRELKLMGQQEYAVAVTPAQVPFVLTASGRYPFDQAISIVRTIPPGQSVPKYADAYSALSGFAGGFPISLAVLGNMAKRKMPTGPDIGWPVHCYGMVGVGRGMSPDTGSGAELYTVIGHAPRHLDRNIALVGRVVEGIEHLSSLPRGSGALGFYEELTSRVPIRSIRVASDLPEDERPRFEYLSTESESFARYAEARANRRDPFFIVPAGGADICNIPVPVRRVVAQSE